MPAYKSHTNLQDEISQPEMVEYESLHTTSQAFEANFERRKYNPASHQQLHQAMRLNPADLSAYKPVVKVQGSGISLQ